MIENTEMYYQLVETGESILLGYDIDHYGDMILVSSLDIGLYSISSNVEDFKLDYLLYKHYACTEHGEPFFDFTIKLESIYDWKLT